MNNIDTILRELGLEDEPFTTAGRFQRPADEAGHGLVKEVLLAGLSFLTLPTSVSVGGQMALASDESIVSFRPDEGVSVLEAVAFPPNPPLESTPSRLCFRLPEVGLQLIRLSDGHLIQVLSTPEHFEIRTSVDLKAEETDAVPKFSVDLSHDAQWLRERVTFHQALDDVWHSAVAAGLHVRFYQPKDAGPIPPVADHVPAYQWLSALSDTQKRLIHSRTVARLDALWEVIDDAESDPDLLLHWRLQRDNLEAVVTLLDRAGAMGDLDERLQEFDDAAMAYLSTLTGDQPFDPQLEHAAVVSPLGWWVASGRLPEA